MNLANLADLICETVRKPDSDSIAAAKNYLKRRDQMLWDGNLWRDSLFTFTQSLDPATDTLLAASGIALLPRAIDRVLAVRLSDQTLPVQNLERYFMDTLDAFAQTGKPVEFALLSPVIWQSATSRNVQVVGSAAGDVDVQFRYIDANDEPQSETFQLTTTPVPYGAKVIEGLEKPPSTGSLTLSVVTGGTVIETMAAADTTLVPKQRIQLLPVPTEALTIRCLVKKRYVPIESDYQEPQLRQAENVLIAYATGDMLRRSNKYGMANEAYAEGAALLAKLENIEFFQQAQRQQLVPEVAEAYGADNRLYGKGYW